jgi:hypothetical protein
MSAALACADWRGGGVEVEVFDTARNRLAVVITMVEEGDERGCEVNEVTMPPIPRP